jgi:ribosomal protein S18
MSLRLRWKKPEKNIAVLRKMGLSTLKFVNDQGKVLPRRLTGTSLKYQRKVAQAIKRARHIALLPYVTDSLK